MRCACAYARVLNRLARVMTIRAFASAALLLTCLRPLFAATVALAALAGVGLCLPLLVEASTDFAASATAALRALQRLRRALDSKLGTGAVAAAAHAQGRAAAAGFSQGPLEPLLACALALAFAGPLLAEAAHAARAGVLLSDALVWSALTVAHAFDYGHAAVAQARLRPRRPLWEHPAFWWAWARSVAWRHSIDAPLLLPPAQAAARADAAALAALSAREARVGDLPLADRARLVELREVCARQVNTRLGGTRPNRRIPPHSLPFVCSLTTIACLRFRRTQTAFFSTALGPCTAAAGARRRAPPRA